MSKKTPFAVRRKTAARGGEAGVLGARVLLSSDERSEGAVFPLVVRLCFGREEGGEVNAAIDDDLLSRVHASIARDGERFMLTDHQSTNGTFLDGRRISAIAVEPGSVFRLGDTLVFFGLLDPVPPSRDAGELLGASLAMRQLREAIDRVAASTLPVLIVGETGTGKELIARRLHEKGGRSGAFVAVNCGAIPATLAEAALFGHKRGAFSGATQDAKGYWERAHKGTLFLDEIGELPLELQPKLLRVLDSGEVTPLGATVAVKTDVRVVSATNAAIEVSVAERTFRQDLYARLQGAIIRPPPLRERREDILLLARHFLRAAVLSVECAEELVGHDWPMNVRELRAACELLATAGVSPLLPEHLPETVRDRAARDGRRRSTGMHEPERDELVRVLTSAEGNVALAAAQFGRDRKQVYRWMEKHGLTVEQFRKG